MRSYNPVRKGHAGQIARRRSCCSARKRPMIYTGGGVILSDAAKQLGEIVRLLGFPCTSTLMGLGGFPASDPQFLGMLGMHGTYEANMAMQNCDVLLADRRAVRRPRDRQPGALRAEPRKIIHIDIDPSSISKRVRVDVPIVGHVPDVLQDLIKLLDGGGRQARHRAAWWKQIGEWRAKDCLQVRPQAPRSSSRSS